MKRSYPEFARLTSCSRGDVGNRSGAICADDMDAETVASVAAAGCANSIRGNERTDLFDLLRIDKRRPALSFFYLQRAVTDEQLGKAGAAARYGQSL